MAHFLHTRSLSLAVRFNHVKNALSGIVAVMQRLPSLFLFIPKSKAVRTVWEWGRAINSRCRNDLIFSLRARAVSGFFVLTVDCCERVVWATMLKCGAYFSVFCARGTGAAAAAKIYLESLSLVAKQAQQGTCGGTSDIGKSPFRLVFIVFHSIQDLLPLTRSVWFKSTFGGRTFSGWMKRSSSGNEKCFM